MFCSSKCPHLFTTAPLFSKSLFNASAPKMQLHAPLTARLSRLTKPKAAVGRHATARRLPVVKPKAVAEPVASAEPSPNGTNRLEALQKEVERAATRLAAAEAALKAEREALLQPEHHRKQELDNFGFIRQFSGEPYEQEIYGVPGSLVEMGIENFLREARELLAAMGFTVPLLRRGEIGIAPPDITPEMLARQEALSQLTLSNAAIWEREHQRPPIKAPWVIKAPYYVLCLALDVLYDHRPIQRFWLLETVARMPYFSYITMLHLYESLGWWRRSFHARKVHFAEEHNEANHLLVMESLGGDQKWVDRFVAQHAAIVYYWVLLILWVLSPTLAYNFSELIEAHAVDTYEQFLDENKEALKALPAPRVAKLYYESPDQYLFQAFQTEREPGTRLAKIDTLYDVFKNIAEDEGEHVNTMHGMQNEDVLARAPNTEALLAATVAALLGAQVWGGPLPGSCTWPCRPRRGCVAAT